MPKVDKLYIQSGNHKIYLELQYPEKYPANAVVVAHGLRSYYPGFLDMFMKALRKSGYITIKFHYLGTGKSNGKFEDKTTAAMLRNYQDVINFLKKNSNIKNIGIMARSNSGALAVINGPDPRIKAYVLLAPPVFYSENLGGFVKSAKVKGKYFYHKSFKRPHTKGPGRLPLNFVEELKRYDKPLQKNIPRMKPVIFFQCSEDEAVPIDEGHYEYWKKHLPNPKKMVLINGGNHSYRGHKLFVIKESIKWFNKYLR